MRFACTAVALLLGPFPSPGAAFSPPKPAWGSKGKNCSIHREGGIEPRACSPPNADENGSTGDGAGEPRGRWPVAAGILGAATANLHVTRALAEGTVGLAGVVATGLLSDGDPGAPAPEVPKEALIELTATPSGTATVVSDQPPPKAPETKPPSAIATVSVEKAAAPPAEKASGDKALDKVENVGAVLGAITDQKIAGAKDTAAAAGGKAVALKKELSPTKAPPLAAFEAVTLVATVSAAIAAGTVVVGYVFASDEARDEGKGEWKADKPVPYGLQDATPEYRMPAGMGGNTERVPKEPPRRAVEAEVASKGAETKGAAPSSSAPAVPKKAAGAVLKGGPVTSPPQAGGGISMAALLKGSAAKKKEEKEWKVDKPTPYGLQDGAAKYAKPATLQSKAAAAVKESLVVPKAKSAAPQFDEGAGIGAAAALKAAQTAAGLKGAVSDGPLGGIPAAKASRGGPKKSFSKGRWKGSGSGGGMLKSGAPGGSPTMAVPAPKVGEGIGTAPPVKGAVAKGGSAAVAPTKKSFAKSSFKPSGAGGTVPGSGGPTLPPEGSNGAEAAAVEMEGASRKASSTPPPPSASAAPPKGTEAGPVAGAKRAPTKKSFAKASFKTSPSRGTVPGAYRVGGAPPPQALAREVPKGVAAAAAEMEGSSRKASASSPLGSGMLKGASSGAGAGPAPGFGKGGAGWLKGHAGSSGGGMLKKTTVSPSPATTPAFRKMKESHARTGAATKGATPKSPSPGGFLSNLEQAPVPANGRSAPPAVATAPRPLPVQAPPPQPAPPAAGPASAPAGSTTAAAATANGRVVPRSIGEFRGAFATAHGVRATIQSAATAGRADAARPATPAQPPAYTNTIYAAPAPAAPAAAPTERPDVVDGRSPPGRGGTAGEGKGPPLSVTITDPRTGKKRTVRASSNASSS
ncbi:hypothetical protein ACHAXT_008485 [Thalassiosira profunda]